MPLIARGAVPNKTEKENGYQLTHVDDLPMWPSGLSTRAPCAVERDALSGRGSNLGPGCIRLPENYFK